MSALPFVIAQLKKTAQFLEMKGDNPFRCRAFVKAAEVLEHHADTFEALLETKRLTDLPGIGKELEKNILDLIATGSFALLDELKKLFPETLLDLLKVPGLGSKKVAFLYLSLGLTTLGELEYACLENRLMHLKGFGEKTQTKIYEALIFLKKSEGQRLLLDAMAMSERFEARLKQDYPTMKVTQVGDLRRKCPVVKQLNYSVSEPVTDSLPSMYEGLAVSYFFSSQEHWVFNVWKNTGCEQHVSSVIEALENAQKLAHAHMVTREEDIYNLAGLPYVAPECREWSVLTQPQGVLNQTIYPTLKGIFHVHSHYSDGKLSIESLVKKSIALGYSYLGLSDHSQSAVYAQGLSAETLKKQYDEVLQLREKYPEIKLFWGIESDILKDGSLDYDDRALSAFDFVIASVHSRFGLNREAMTERCVRALENPRTTMLGHATGRLLLARDAFEVDLEKLMEVAVQRGKIIELNANPQRLDVPWEILAKAPKSLLTSINPDIHDEQGFEHTRVGCFMAQKAMLNPSHILNTRSAQEIEDFFENQRKI